MRKILIVIVLTVLVIFGIYFVQHRWNNENTEIGMAEKIDEVKEEPKEDITINMTVTGDVLCHNTNFFDAYNASTDSYDFSYSFFKCSSQSLPIIIFTSTYDIFHYFLFYMSDIVVLKTLP